MGKMINLIKLAIPLYGEKKRHYNKISEHIDPKEIKKYLKTKKIGVTYDRNKTTLIKLKSYPVLHTLEEDVKFQKRIDEINKEIKNNYEQIAFKEFSKNAELIIKHISPGILGMENIKKAAYLQMFSAHRVHLLLLGDPGVGKTEILRAVDVLAPKASFGLGSGASKAGLTISVSGKKIIPGLLPMANKGIACIDELNLMKAKDRGGLLNAMEKGFVTYTKARAQEQMEADVRVLATANPKGDRFISERLGMLKEQLPFEDALMSRFHLVFIVRKPDIQQFLEITKSMLKDKSKMNFDDVYFIRSYIQEASKIDVEFPKNFEPMLLNFVEDVKLDENKFIQEINPRFVKGVIAMAKAKARSHLREKVVEEDLMFVFKVAKDCLYRNLSSKSSSKN